MRKKDEDIAFEPVEWRCIWTTHGRRCFLPGTISPDIGEKARKYCHWHYVNLNDPRNVEDFEEFERWQAMWARYCSLENHYTNATLWDAIQGKAHLPKEVEKWCGNVICHRFSIVDTDRWIREGKGNQPPAGINIPWKKPEDIGKPGKRHRRPAIPPLEVPEILTEKNIQARIKLGVYRPRED